MRQVRFSVRQIMSGRDGFTLTEAAIVLGIVGLVLSSIWVAAGAVYDNMRVQTMYRQITQITANIRQLYASQGAITGTDYALTDSLARAGIFPKDMILDPNAASIVPKNPWGGTVVLTGLGPNFFIISFGIPRDECPKLIMMLTGGNRDSGLTRINGSSTDKYVFPMPLQEAVATCSNPFINKVPVTVFFNLRA